MRSIKLLIVCTILFCTNFLIGQTITVTDNKGISLQMDIDDISYAVKNTAGQSVIIPADKNISYISTSTLMSIQTLGCNKFYVFKVGKKNGSFALNDSVLIAVKYSQVQQTTTAKAIVKSIVNGFSLQTVESYISIIAQTNNSCYTSGGGGSFWGITGTAGTNPITNYIGTSDNVDVVFKRNNIESGYINGTTNTVFGQGNAVRTSSTGTLNSIYGVGNMTSNTTGSVNSAFGRDNAKTNISGSNLSVFGNANFAANTTGGSNTGVGRENFSFASNGSNNTGIGFRNFYSNTTAGFNFGGGYYNFNANTTGENNVGVGRENFNMNTTGSHNTGIGRDNYYFNTTASFNFGGGYRNFMNNTTGDYAVGIGTENFKNNTTGGRNIGIGLQNFVTNTTGSFNIGIGANANATPNTTGNYNILLGHNNLSSNFSGSNNTAIGFNNFYHNILGSNNIVYGNNNVLFLNPTNVTALALSSLTVTDVTGGINISGAAIGTAITNSGGVTGNVIFSAEISALSTGSAQIVNSTTIFRAGLTAAAVAGKTLTLTIPATVNNSVVIGNNIQVRDSNTAILGGVGTRTVRFRGEAGYNYNFNLSKLLAEDDNNKVWTYNHATADLTLKSVSDNIITNGGLVQFAEKVKTSITGIIDILFIGDSRTEAPYTFEALWYKLCEKYGDGGIGTVSLGAIQHLTGATYLLSGCTALDLSGLANSSPIGKALQFTQNGFISLDFTPLTYGKFTSVDIYYPVQGTAYTYNVKIDNVSVGSFTTATSGAAVQKATFSGFTDAKHKIEIIQTSTGTGTLLEMNLKRNGVNGVRMHRLGNGGTTAGQIAALQGNTYLYQDIDPTLSFIRFGINGMASNTSLANAQNVIVIADSIRANGGKDIVVLGETANNDATQKLLVDGFNTTLETLTKEKNYAYFNLKEICPDWAAWNSNGYTLDNYVHENDIGGNILGNFIFKKIYEPADVGVIVKHDVNAQISPLNNTTETINWGTKISNYQSVSAPANLTLAYTASVKGAIYHIAIAPTGASSTVTFTGFVENAAAVTTKTFTDYTVLTVRQLTVTSAEIVNVYTPISIMQKGTTSTFASIATGANGTAVSVTFSPAFAATPNIQLTPNAQVFCWVTTKSASGFSCNCRNDSGGALTPAVDWIAR